MGSDEDEKLKEPGRIMKPSEIPIYGGPRELLRPSGAKSEQATAVSEPGVLQQGFRTVREAAQSVIGPFQGLDARAREIYETGKAHSQAYVNEEKVKATFDQLQEPENAPMRVGFIATGGLLGYAIGALRGRLLKKVFYGLLGTGGTAAVCYPAEARSLANDFYDEGRRTAQIAYNFVNGVQPEGSSDAGNKEPKSEDKQPKETSGKSLLSPIVPDYGQSNPADKDLYSTRGSS